MPDATTAANTAATLTTEPSAPLGGQPDTTGASMLGVVVAVVLSAAVWLVKSATRGRVKGGSSGGGQNR